MSGPLAVAIFKKEDEWPRIGDSWVNILSGLEYRWDGKQWVSTEKYPHGEDPMGLINES